MRCLVAREIICQALFLLILIVTPVEKVQATSIFTGEFFASDSRRGLFKVNTATGAATRIGDTVAGDTVVVMTDIAFSPSGNLFGVTFTDLYSVDPNTAASTLIGSLEVNGSNALEFDPNGTLFMATSNSTLLRTVNTTMGATTVVGDMGVSSSGDLAFDPSSGKLFLSASPFPNNDLYQINPNTAASTLVGNIGFQDVFGIDFSGNTLFGLTNGGELITINTTSGAGTLVANTVPVVAAFGASTAPTSDHFKCYKANGDRIDQIVYLRDQFGEEDARVGKPKLFCNPVDKNGEGIVHPEIHLTCYEIRQPDNGHEHDGDEREVIVENQFGAQALELEESKLLCVPSTKTVVDLVD